MVSAHSTRELIDLMASKVYLEFSLTDDAKSVVVRAIEKISQYRAIPAIMWGKPGDFPRHRWMVRYYDREVVSNSDFPGYLFEVDGIEFLVPQPQVLERLRGKELQWLGDRFDVQESP